MKPQNALWKSALIALAAGLRDLAAHAEAKTDFKVCWSIYAGWMPWGTSRTPAS